MKTFVSGNSKRPSKNFTLNDGEREAKIDGYFKRIRPKKSDREFIFTCG